MLKKSLILAALLLLLPLVLAAGSKSIFDGILKHGEPVTINNTEYVYTINDEFISTFISTTSGAVIVANGTCETKDDLSYCVNTVLFDYHDEKLDKDYYKGEVEISKPIADITITREFDQA